MNDEASLYILQRHSTPESKLHDQFINHLHAINLHFTLESKSSTDKGKITLTPRAIFFPEKIPFKDMSVLFHTGPVHGYQ